MLGRKEPNLINIFNCFRERFAAGIMITIGCIINVAMIHQGDRLAGAFFFAIGLTAIVMYKMVLFTGICGYLTDFRPFKHKTGTNLLVTWLYNMAGCAVFGMLMLKGIDSNYLKVTNELMVLKMNLPIYTLVSKGIFCGMLMHLAVLSARQDFHPVVKLVTVFMCVATFILCKFEHSIANMGYLFMSDVNVIMGIYWCIIPVTIGNIIGGCFMQFILRYNEDIK